MSKELELHDKIVQLRKDRGMHLMDENEYTHAILDLITAAEARGRREELEHLLSLPDIPMHKSQLHVKAKYTAAIRGRLAALQDTTGEGK